MVKRASSIGKCLNCGEKITLKYCPYCGQERDTKRFVVRTIFNQVISAIFSWDNLFLRTFKQLLTKPGYFVKDYLKGKRKPYVKPFSFFMFFLTVNVLVFHWLSGKYISIIVNSINSTTSDVKLTSFDNIQRFIEANINNMYFILPFIYAFSLKVFLKKKTGINYAEALVFSLYCYAIFLFLDIMNMFLSIIDARMMGFSLIVSLVYLSIAVMQFSGSTKIKGFVTGSFVTVLSYIIFMIIIAIAVIAYKLLFGVHKVFAF